MGVDLQKHWPMRLYFLKARGIGNSDGEVVNRSQIVHIKC